MPATGSTTHLVCQVAGHRFALPASQVRQVHRAVAVDPLPGAPDPVIGIVHVHGELLPVLALRRRLGLTEQGVRPDDVLVRLDVRGRPMLLLADAAVSVLTISPEDVRGADDVVPGAAYLRGVTGMRGEVLVIHDVDTFLSGGDLLDLGAALARLLRSESERPDA